MTKLMDSVEGMAEDNQTKLIDSVEGIMRHKDTSNRKLLGEMAFQQLIDPGRPEVLKYSSR